MIKTTGSTEFKIAVTGHRHIDANQILIDSIISIFHELIENNIGKDYYLYSAVAEGSDQLVADLALRNEDIKLIITLPLSASDYLDDFETHFGIQKFSDLVQSAHRIIQLPDQPDHETAYQFLGEFLVKECDVLIAIWNGTFSNKPGGTSEVVKLATKMEKPIIWIYSSQTINEANNSLLDKKQPGEIEFIGFSSLRD